MAPLDPVDLKTNREVVPVIQLIQFIYILGQRTPLSESSLSITLCLEYILPPWFFVLVGKLLGLACFLKCRMEMEECGSKFSWDL